MKEIWILIKNSEGYNNHIKRGTKIYISNYGRIKRNNEIIDLSYQKTHKSKYMRYMGKYVHRWVAELFVYNDDPKNKNHVDHINGNRYDNRAENLRWVTQKQNNQNPITRNRISNALKGHTPPIKGSKGIRNWVTKGNITELILKTDLQKYLDDGYHLGRN